MIRTVSALLLAVLLALSGPVRAEPMPPGIADPDKAILDPTYSDPVFFWRITSAPADVFEPDPYFYWPSQAIAGGVPQELPKRTAPTSIPAPALAEMAAWAEAHGSNALIVIHKGVVQLERYWNGTTSDTLLNGRAITRSVTPLLLGFAVADGALVLDDPIGKFIPEWANDPRGAISVRQLGQNASGLEVAPTLPVSQIQGNKDLCLAYCGDAVRAALAYEQTHPPGTRFEVAQENMQLLAHVIERATGTPIQTLMSKRVWKKIGAADAAVQLDRPGGVARMMCCMRARAMDWARLGLLVAQDGRWNGKQVLPAGWVGTMAKPSPTNASFGLGLWLGSPFVPMRTYFEGKPGVIPQSEPFLADDVLMMEGGGFRIVHMVPSAELVIMRHGRIDPAWDAAFLVNNALRSLKR